MYMSKLLFRYEVGQDKVFVSSVCKQNSPNDKFVSVLPITQLRALLNHLAGLADDWSLEVPELPVPDNALVASTLLRVAEDESDFLFKPLLQERNIDEDSLRLINEIHWCLVELRKRGISTRTVREALLQRQTFSRLVVTSDFRILLPDFDNLEVQMTPLTKAVYLLFLRHSEGISLKRISEHREELMSIYSKMKPNINPARRAKQIEDLVDPTHNSLNEKLSLIRRSFARVLDEALLEQYIVTGTKGEVRRVLLSNSLIFS